MNKSLLELAAFQVNTIVFQGNTNASLNNLETQVGQLTLSMQHQSKDVFPSDTKKNSDDCIEMTLRRGRELESRKERLRKKRKQKLEKRPSRVVQNWLKKLRKKRCRLSS